MTQTGELYNFGVERALDPIEVEAFTDQVLLRGVNFLWGGEFLMGAQTGEELSVKKSKYTQGEITKVDLYAGCFIDDEYASPGMCTIKLEIATRAPELTSRMISVASMGNSESSGILGDGQLLEGWEIKSFYFDFGINLEYGLNTHLELQDHDGEVLWSDEYLVEGGDDTEPEYSEQDDDTIDDLDRILESNMCNSDLEKIKTAFEVLGIPVQMFS